MRAEEPRDLAKVPEIKRGFHILIIGRVNLNRSIIVRIDPVRVIPQFNNGPRYLIKVRDRV